jgi:DNA-binding NarL/FixJ family response regulator
MAKKLPDILFIQFLDLFKHSDNVSDANHCNPDIESSPFFKKLPDSLHCGKSHTECQAILNLLRMLDKDSQELKVCTTTTERENEVIRHIAQGTKTKAIAEKMHVSIHTVRTHKANIFVKTKTTNIAGLTSYAYTNGII